MTGVRDDVCERRLRQLVVAADLGALRTYADALDGAGTKAARAWAASAHDFDDHPGPPELAGLDTSAAWERRQAIRAARTLLVGCLEPPVAAARAVMRLGRRGPTSIHPEMIAAFTSRDRTWAEAFVAAADAITPPADGGGATVALLMRHVVLTHRLAVPSGRLFHGNWLRVSPRWHGEHALTDLVRVDPLMPEILLQQLASGEAGQNPTLPDAVATLVDEGWVGRDDILAVVVEHLGANQRVSSQRVLAGIASRLALVPEEVPGGLPTLLGTISAAHGAVAKVALPLAIELVRSADDLDDLVRIVATRPEKALRRQLLASLAPDRLGRRLGHPHLVSAIDVLAHGEEDVAVRAACAKAQEALGARPPDPAAPPPDALGLWDLPLEPRGPRPEVPSWVAPLRDRCWLALRAGESSSDPTLVDHVLDALAHDEVAGADLSATAHELAVEGRLSPARAVALLEPLFLGGAMREVWPVALEVADLSAGGSRPAPGLDKLLRMLVAYAAEPPTPVDLPPHVLRLARGRSKAAQEAHRLATLLGSGTDPGEHRPTVLGLWSERHEPEPWALAYPPGGDLATLGRRIAATPLSEHDVRGQVRRSVLESRLLDELATTVSQEGRDTVRAAMVSEPPRWSGPLAQAVALWARGHLSASTYWAMAQSRRTTADVMERWQQELGQHTALVRAHEWLPSDGLDLTPPVMPAWWTADGQASPHHHSGMRLRFLHACEVLLVLDGRGHLVSTPDVIDGSLGLARLLQRLREAPRVGPLDLRLALGRLRPTGVADADDVRDLAHTDPDVTSPARDRTEDAGALVRHWVAAGGLRLAPRRRPEPGLWEHDATAPVPWSSWAALGAAPVSDGPASHRHFDTWSLPGRPDLWLRNGFVAVSSDESLADVGGTIGVAGWDTLLVALGSGAGSYYAPDFASLVRLQDQGRLDPAVAAAAARARWDSGEPDVIGSALGWERAMLRGAIRGLWPVAVAVVEAGRSRSHPPPDLDALVRVLARRAHEVPTDAVPDFVMSS